MGSGAPEHRSNCSENLAEFIVEFAGDVAEGGFLSRDQFLSKFAAAFGDFGEAPEQAAVPADQGQAIQQDGEKGCGKEEVNLALYTVINLDNSLSGLFFIFCVLHQEASYGCAQCCLAFLE